jgi:hypothetical protein
MLFTLTIRIEPSAPFGVPQPGTTVVPAAPGTINGPPVHGDTGTVVGHGTLSTYRREDAAITLNLKSNRGVIRLRDNFAFIDVEATDSGTAFRAAASLADRFLQHFTISDGQLFTFSSLILESEDRRLHPIPRLIELGTFTAYNLDTLKAHLEEAATYLEIEDKKLILAIDYLQQALALFLNSRAIADPLYRQHSMLISSAFLNMWKAISTIVGDPSIDSDYQSRYKALGLDHDFFQTKIEKVRNLRNQYDVAHYSLDISDIDAVEHAFGEATNVALETIRRYRSTITAA